jgi:hypothetical protein
LNGLYDLYEFQINVQILGEKVKSAVQWSLKKEEELRLRRDRVKGMSLQEIAKRIEEIRDYNWPSGISSSGAPGI